MKRFVLLAIVLLSAAFVSANARPSAAEPLIIQIDMIGTEQVPPVNTRTWGFVRFFFSDDRLSAEYNVDVKGLSYNIVLGADIHRGAPGVNGPVVKHLADGGFLVTSGRLTLTRAELDEMAGGGWYVSLKSEAHPDGEIRGQIVLPPGFLSQGEVAPPRPIAPPVDFDPGASSEHPPAGEASPPPAAPPTVSGPRIVPPSTGDGGLLR